MKMFKEGSKELRKVVKERTKLALDVGKTAFEMGMSCIPAHDTELMLLMVGLPVGSSLPILKAWQKGWIIANLDAPVE